HSDSLLVKAGSGALTLGVPTSPGVPDSLAEHTLTLEYNNINQVLEVLKEVGSQVACIIVEPVAGNMNCIPPVDGFLHGLRKACDEHNIILIFDEVMTGFRVALGGAQSYYDVNPDLTTLGKVIGGGLPVGAFGGRKEIMEFIAPMGPVYQAGTLSGNPISMSAGLAMLNILSEDKDFYKRLNYSANKLVNGILSKAKIHGINMTSNVVGGMFGLFFTKESKVTNFEQSSMCNIELFKDFYRLMLNEGVYLAPSAYEAGFISSMHSDADIEFTINAADRVFAKL
ncbi:MAG TPA: aspartate aminotransferase family protein, partial [Gammaproteobacteria bacterium]|nr:aspartate aminotransferase family protein [Gammaproteobacteria bacterium]